jgi:hypothetical protein
MLLSITIMSGPVLAAGTNDFPTLARVDHVLTCMKEHGGQTLDNLYACVCEIDAIAGKMSFSDYEEASTFSTMRNMPGDRGGVYRHSAEGEKMATHLKDVQQAASSQCFLRPAKAKASVPAADASTSKKTK